MANEAFEKTLVHLESCSLERKRWLVEQGLKAAFQGATRDLEAMTAKIAPDVDPVETVQRILKNCERSSKVVP